MYFLQKLTLLVAGAALIVSGGIVKVKNMYNGTTSVSGTSNCNEIEVEFSCLNNTMGCLNSGDFVDKAETLKGQGYEIDYVFNDISTPDGKFFLNDTANASALHDLLLITLLDVTFNDKIDKSSTETNDQNVSALNRDATINTSADINISTVSNYTSPRYFDEDDLDFVGKVLLPPFDTSKFKREINNSSTTNTNDQSSVRLEDKDIVDQIKIVLSEIKKYRSTSGNMVNKNLLYRHMQNKFGVDFNVLKEKFKAYFREVFGMNIDIIYEYIKQVELQNNPELSTTHYNLDPLNSPFTQEQIILQEKIIFLYTHYPILITHTSIIEYLTKFEHDSYKTTEQRSLLYNSIKKYINEIMAHRNGKILYSEFCDDLSFYTKKAIRFINKTNTNFNNMKDFRSLLIELLFYRNACFEFEELLKSEPYYSKQLQDGLARFTKKTFDDLKIIKPNTTMQEFRKSSNIFIPKILTILVESKLIDRNVKKDIMDLLDDKNKERRKKTKEFKKINSAKIQTMQKYRLKNKNKMINKDLSPSAHTDESDETELMVN